MMFTYRRAAVGAATLGALIIGVVAATGDSPSFEWNASDCAAAIVIVPASADELEAHLPAGFEPVMPESVKQMLPPDPRLEAAFGFETFTCATETIGSNTATDTVYGSLWTFVEPPSELADPDYPFAFYKWLTLIDDEDQRDTLARHGTPVTDGIAEIANVASPGLGGLTDMSVRFKADGSYRITGSTSNPVDPFEGDLIEYSALDRDTGYVLWRTHYAAPVAFGGAGVATWNGSAFAAEVLGTTEAQAYLLTADDFALTDGSITIDRRSAAP